jgi:hypothetical protein
MDKRRLTYLLGGILVITVWLLLMREAESPKTGVADYFAPVAVNPPVGGTTITRADPEALVPVIRAQIAGSPSAVRLGEIVREFAAAEGLALPQPDLRQPSIIATITVNATASLTIDRAGTDGQARLWLSVQDKAMGEVPALRPVFDRMVAKVRDAFPDNPIEEVD